MEKITLKNRPNGVKVSITIVGDNVPRIAECIGAVNLLVTDAGASVAGFTVSKISIEEKNLLQQFPVSIKIGE